MVIVLPVVTSILESIVSTPPLPTITAPSSVESLVHTSELVIV